MEHFADRLIRAIRSKSSVLCVGLDPRWELLPREIRCRHQLVSLESAARAFAEFCIRTIDIVAPLVPAVKPQSAFFEACGPAGLAALQQTIRHARSKGLVTILDNKRNDIASTAAAYADAALGGVFMEDSRFPVWDADALTVNPYLGRDAMEPFLQSARRTGAGVFVLVRTSNPGAGQFQDLQCEGQPLYLHVAAAVRNWTLENLGREGFGDVGAVVGATHPRELAAVRTLLPEAIFLVPGYGAQGGGAGDTAPAFLPGGLGAIVNSSRGISACFDPDAENWQESIATATVKANRELADAAFKK